MKKYSILNISGHEKLSPSMPRNSCYGQKLDYFSSAIAACAAASLAIGTLYGEQLTYVKPAL